ncbi:NAD-dependent epimerase/dehydratase family protein [Streptomyces lydicus]|uniref:NAD-dependent epimerase/dehydratase family protein n=1 Tax=Streptomyces lydicus TaxID=47763 RepID=UPI0036E1E9FE
MSTAGRHGRHTVVTGGAGFVGSHLCTTLLDQGYSVTCVDDYCTGSAANVAHLVDRPGFTIRRADVAKGLDITERMEMVFHLASPASPMDYLRLPVHTLEAGSLGTRNALALAQRHGARFLLASTSEVYGNPLQHPQSENYWGNVNPVGPRSVYDEAKRFAEALTAAMASAHGVNTAIVRLFNTYGPGMRSHDGRAVPTFVRQALAGQPLTVTGDGSQTRSLTYVDDTVEGILAMAHSDLAGPVNIGSDIEFTMAELADFIIELTSSRSHIEFVERPTDDPAVRRPDITLARGKLRWEPRTSVREGLERTITWFREHPEA